MMHDKQTHTTSRAAAKENLKRRFMTRPSIPFSEKDAEEAAEFWTAPVTEEDERRILLGLD